MKKESENTLLVMVDNGHGRETPGKCSPDGRIKEWEWTRRAGKAIVKRLLAKGVDATLLVTEERDVPLRERCRRARTSGSGRNAVLLSIHVNAAGDGGAWHNARGFCAFVAPGASRQSVRMASLLTSLAGERGLSGNRCVPPDGCWRGNFAILRDTPMPAVLTENLFMDNREDAVFLDTDVGLDAVVQLHVDAVLKYFNTQG